MNPPSFNENNPFNRQEKPNRNEAIQKTVNRLLPMHKKVLSILSGMSIKPSSFTPPIGLYDSEQVDRDLQYVERMQKVFEQSEHELLGQGSEITMGDVKKLADILEYEIIKGINLHNWLPFCKAIKTSEFDDIVNGVDMIVEFTKSAQISHLGLGVDVSFSHNLEKKFVDIKKSIDEYNGEDRRLSKIKYFESKATGIKGELKDVPRVVAALDIGIIEELATKGTDYDHHSAKHELITSIEKQLQTFRDYAERTNPLAVPPIKRAYKFISVMSEQLHSTQTLEHSDTRENAQMKKVISENLEMFKSG